MSYEYTDANGEEIKVGDRIRIPGADWMNSDLMSHGVITKIDEPDGDVDDEGRAIGIDPEVHIKFDDGDEDHFNGRWTGTFYTDDAPFQFEDIEKIKEGS